MTVKDSEFLSFPETASEAVLGGHSILTFYDSLPRTSLTPPLAAQKTIDIPTNIIWRI